jgi:solute carrier family 13 (sodium-dependent dicarboxylate transporter), member 2/3/5
MREQKSIIIRRIVSALFCMALFLALLVTAPIDKPHANQTLAIATLMVSLWVTNAIPFGMTALIPIVAFPLFGIVPILTAIKPYYNPLVLLFVGGLMIATAIQKWDLHKRIALNVILLVGTDTRRIIFGFIVASGFLSMWVSNTATTLMMLPIGLSVIYYVKTHDGLSEDNPFAAVLMLAIAYSSSIGGMGTIVGTISPAFTVAFLAENHKIHISFAQWFAFGLPFVVIALPLSYLVLTRLAFKVQKTNGNATYSLIHKELKDLGPMNRTEKIILLIFSLVVIAWVIPPLILPARIPLMDTIVALCGGCSLFILPAKEGKRILSITDLKLIPWSVLFLLGGGLALANVVKGVGLDLLFAELFYFAKDLNYSYLLLLVITSIILLSEFTSNTATTAAFIPVIATVAVNFNLNPALLAIPAALAANCAFMLPVATPPNAIIFGSKLVTIGQMVRGGIYLNLLFILLLMGFGLLMKVFITS